HHQYLPDKITAEPGVLNKKVIAALTAMGHQVEELTDTYGNMQVVIANKKTRRVEAASDPRGVGSAEVLR
ncbi:MAG: gamma-glutamyltransferase, partial [Gammaproteobacteria bacterium]|nr:gamma-glutamyltransferase [Gammaproteobacteria bacterium]